MFTCTLIYPNNCEKNRERERESLGRDPPGKSISILHSGVCTSIHSWAVGIEQSLATVEEQ